MKTSVVVLLILTSHPAFVSSANAQDVLGLYFDPAGTVDRATTTGPNEIVTAYLVLKDPSRTGGVDSWECRVEATTDGPAPFLSWTLAGAAVNAANTPSFYVGLGSPLPSTGDVLLATAMVVVPEPGHEIRFLVLPHDPPSLQSPPGSGYPLQLPVYGSGVELVPMESSSGCIGGAAAVVNDDGVQEDFPLEHNPYVYFGSETGSRSRTLRLFNRGDHPVGGLLRIQGPAFSFRIGDGSTTTDDSWFRIEPGEDVAVLVNYDAALDDGSQGLFLLETCGGTREIVFNMEDPFPLCAVTPSFLDLGIGTPEEWPEQILTVRNVGSALLEGSFSIDEPAFKHPWSYFSLLPGRAQDFTIRLQTQDMGFYQGTITFTSTADCGDAIPISGALVDGTPGGEVTPDTLRMVAPAPGGEARKTITFWNSSPDPVSGTAVISDWYEDFTITAGGGAFTLGQFENHVVEVAFTPSTTGMSRCEFTVGSEFPRAYLEGRGLNPFPSCRVEGAAGDTLDFGPLIQGEWFEPWNFLTNDGDTTLTIRPRSDTTHFRVLSPLPTLDVAPGETVRFVLLIDTSEEGVLEGRLDFGDEACGEIVLRRTVYPDDDPLDRLRIFFDDELQENRFHVPSFTGPLTGFLVLDNPSGLDGLLDSWQVCVSEVGDPVISGWVIQAPGYSNALTAPCFDLIQDPMPLLATTVLADIEMMVGPGHSFTDFFLDPIPDPALPGSITYHGPDGWTAAATHTGRRWVASLNTGGPTSVELLRPRDLALNPNYPNPFNPSTTVPFEIAKAGHVRLAVYDLAGRLVAVLADGEFGAGYHEETWTGIDTAGRRVPTGAYYLRLESGGQVRMRQMMILK